MRHLTKKFIELINMGIAYAGRRKENTFVFGAWYGEKFADNPKYLYLYYLENGRNAVWVTKSQEVYWEMIKNGLPVCLYGTEKEKRISRNAKCFFYCCSLDDINKYNAAGATMINLWHGVPLKKIMYDDTYNYCTGRDSLYKKVAKKIMQKAFAETYVVSTSKEISRIYEGAFRLKPFQILNLGQPRNDCFYNSSINKVRYGDRNYEKLITYMPTMRDMGKKTIDLKDILDLNRIDEMCKKENALFLVKKHYCHRDEYTELGPYSNIIDMTTQSIDTQELLYNTDVLVTDYSSCYIDYLLLNKPIVYYAYDYEDYIKKDREMYFPYEKVTPGNKAYTFERLYEEIKEALNNATVTDDSYNKVRDMFYDPENQGTVSNQIMLKVDQILQKE